MRYCSCGLVTPADVISGISRGIQSVCILYVFQIEAEFKIESAEKPGHAIVDTATKTDAAFIVTGTRGMGKIRRTILGSVSDFVVHHAPCPVLVCRHKDK